jgi:lysophosphatidic acid phosphatase type 6
LGEVAETVDAAVRDPLGKTKLMVWSGHDSTLVPVLSALGLVEQGMAPYASHLELEFAKVKNKSLNCNRPYNRNHPHNRNHNHSNTDTITPPPHLPFWSAFLAQDADGELFVRAIYNNEERQIEGCGGAWCPYFRYKRRMSNVSLTPGAYAAECGEVGGAAGDESESDQAARGAMETGIRATTGGN